MKTLVFFCLFILMIKCTNLPKLYFQILSYNDFAELDDFLLLKLLMVNCTTEYL